MRLTVLAAIIAAALPAMAPPLAAQDFRLAMNHGVTAASLGDQLRTRIEGRGPAFYGGVNATTLARHDELGALDLYVGLTPRLGITAFDLRFTQVVDAGGRVALLLDRPLGPGGVFAARLDVDTAADTARSEARTSFDLNRRTRITGVFGARLDADGDESLSLSVSTSRRIADYGALDLSLRNATDAAPRAAFSLGLRF